MLLKFTGYNIFVKLLRYIGIFALPDDNYALNFAVDLLANISFIFITLPPSLYKPEGSVIVIVFDFVEEDQFLFVISAGEEHHHRCV